MVQSAGAAGIISNSQCQRRPARPVVASLPVRKACFGSTRAFSSGRLSAIRRQIDTRCRAAVSYSPAIHGLVQVIQIRWCVSPRANCSLRGDAGLNRRLSWETKLRISPPKPCLTRSSKRSRCLSSRYVLLQVISWTCTITIIVIIMTPI